MDATVVSCPGKVLLAGGYLVLSAQHHGFVLSTPSRFYTVVHNVPTFGGDAVDSNKFTVTVKSPQFSDGEWAYTATKTAADARWTVAAQQGEHTSPKNPFVHLAIQSTLLLASALSSSTVFSSLMVTIVGSNDFYSQARTDAEPEPFAPLGVKLKDVHKTGLGSSAAMVTSLCAALLLHWDSQSSSSSASKTATSALPDSLPSSPTILSSSPPPPALFPQPTHAETPDKDTLSLIHNLAQYVHSLAQGKVGSGFDVSAAVYGSHVYRRFAVECLNDLLNEAVNADEITSQRLLKALSPMMNPTWTKKSTAALVSPFALPPRTILLLADVDAGSNTPSMVGKVMAWKKEQPEESDKLWDALRTSNADLAEAFASLARVSKEDPNEYDRQVDELSRRKNTEWSSCPYPFDHAVKHIQTTRGLMRQMGEASGVPIEPPEQTRLLDACSAVPGVIGAGVPGAGGYDAIWVLALCPSSTATGSSSSSSSSSSSPELAIEQLWRDWTEMSVRPLSRHAWIRGGVKTVESGLLQESLESVPGLRRVVGGF